MDWLLWIVLGVILVFGIVVVRGAPYVPSHHKYARKSLTKLYPLSQKDTLVDLGSGDGIILRIAAEKRARAIGYELNPFLVGIAKLLSWGNSRVGVKAADYWLIELPKETTIVYIFAVSRDTGKLEMKMQQWTNELGHELYLMTYGSKLPSIQPIKVLDAHSLYRFTPEALQRRQA
jgi:SAM-dependent methyltransferase